MARGSMRASARIVSSYDGIGEVLKSNEIETELMRHAEPVRAAMQAAEPDWRFFIWTSGNGSRVVVHVGTDAPEAMFEERYTGQLARALDAAR